MSFFVTGTDTGVGKTHTVVQLLRILRSSGKSCAGFKPICCGDRQDAERLLGASADGLTIDEINPLWLKTPAAPLTAGQIEDVKINVEPLLGAFRALRARVDDVFVEGVGGWLVPIRSDYCVRDLAMEMRLPVLVVAKNRHGWRRRRIRHKRGCFGEHSRSSVAARIGAGNGRIGPGMEADFEGFEISVSVNQSDTIVNKLYTKLCSSPGFPSVNWVAPPLLNHLATTLLICSSTKCFI